MNRVLVTGASGFIGRHALELLVERGFDVHAVTHRDTHIRHPGCTWHAADLLDLAQIEPLMGAVRPTHLLHFAWYAVPGQFWTSRDNFVWVQASLELLRRFQEVGGARVVMAGTCAEYDWAYGHCSEHTTPTRPHTVYGTCKLALCSMLAAYARETHLSSAWGRIFFLYGPHEHPSRLVASVVRSLLRGEVARCSHGNQLRDFLHVHDVADAFAALLDSGVEGAVNMASGQPVALKDVIYRIGTTLGRGDLIRLGAVPAAPDDPHLLCADVQRLSDDVGWSPRYDLDSGLATTIMWWQHQLTGEKATQSIRVSWKV